MALKIGSTSKLDLVSPPEKETHSGLAEMPWELLGGSPTFCASPNHFLTKAFITRARSHFHMSSLPFLLITSKRLEKAVSQIFRCLWPQLSR